MSPSAIPALASPKLRRLSPFASNARNAAEMPEKASFRESRRACRGHCTSKRRKPSDTVGVSVEHTSWSQLVPVLVGAHLHSSSLVRPDWVGSQFSSVQTPSPHFEHSSAWPPVEYSPGPHSSQVPPLDEYLPASQASQAELSEFEVSPASQFEHVVAHFPSEYFPAPQSLHVPDATSQRLPGQSSAHWTLLPAQLYPSSHLHAPQLDAADAFT